MSLKDKGPTGPCQHCGCTEWTKREGYHYCNQCGRQGAGGVDEADDEEMVTHARVKRVVKRAKKRIITFEEAFQLILQEQVKVLVQEFKLPAELYTVVGRLWLRFVEIREFKKQFTAESGVNYNDEQKGPEEVDYSEEETSDETDKETDDQLGEDIFGEILQQSQTRAETESKIRLADAKLIANIPKDTANRPQGRICLSYTLAFTYFGARMLAYPIMLVDIFRYALEGRIPYLNARKYLPENVPYLAFKPTQIGLHTYKSTWDHCNILAAALNIYVELDPIPNQRIPEPCFVIPIFPVPLRYAVYRLRLPVELIEQTERLMRLLPWHETFVSRTSSPDIKAMSYALVILKLCYGFKDSFFLESSAPAPDPNTEQKDIGTRILKWISYWDNYYYCSQNGVSIWDFLLFSKSIYNPHNVMRKSKRGERDDLDEDTLKEISRATSKRTKSAKNAKASHDSDSTLTEGEQRSSGSASSSDVFEDDDMEDATLERENVNNQPRGSSESITHPPDLNLMEVEDRGQIESEEEDSWDENKDYDEEYYENVLKNLQSEPYLHNPYKPPDLPSFRDIPHVTDRNYRFYVGSQRNKNEHPLTRWDWIYRQFLYIFSKYLFTKPKTLHGHVSEIEMALITKIFDLAGEHSSYHRWQMAYSTAQNFIKKTGIYVPRENAQRDRQLESEDCSEPKPEAFPNEGIDEDPTRDGVDIESDNEDNYELERNIVQHESQKQYKRRKRRGTERNIDRDRKKRQKEAERVMEEEPLTQSQNMEDLTRGIMRQAEEDRRQKKNVRKRVRFVDDAQKSASKELNENTEDTVDLRSTGFETEDWIDSDNELHHNDSPVEDAEVLGLAEVLRSQRLTDKRPEGKKSTPAKDKKSNTSESQEERKHEDTNQKEGESDPEDKDFDDFLAILMASQSQAAI